MRALILLMRLMAPLPVGVVRAIGWIAGHVLYALAHERRAVVEVNLALCFPEWTDARRRLLARQHMVMVMQALLDRSWLWHGSTAMLRRRLRVVGDIAPLRAPGGVVVFAPHFVGMDAGGLALTVLEDLPMSSIYVSQRDPTLDAWVRQGRSRAGHSRLYFRREGVKQILADLRQGGKLYLLPDLDFGPEESVFAPFFGVPAATLPSLARFARLGRAQVLTVVTCMTARGYEVRVGPVWEDFPGQDAVQDATRMNQVLEQEVRTMPAQYYWVHKRFKTRPPGQAPVYGPAV